MPAASALSVKAIAHPTKVEATNPTEAIMVMIMILFFIVNVRVI
jgi:hypothetical protein